MLGAYAGDAEAMNNFAVLLYCEIANPRAYDEERVWNLLFRAAMKGCKTAADNLSVLRYNRGEEAELRFLSRTRPSREVAPCRPIDGGAADMIQYAATIWRGGRVAEGNGLLNRRTG